MSDLVSVIMPVRGLNKHYRLFAGALSGIKGQTCKDFELIIIIDGPDGDTKGLVQRATPKQINGNPVRIFMTDSNNGPGIARNTVYKYATGNYVTFHDSDDYSFFSRFERLLVAVKESSLGVAASNFRMDRMINGQKKFITKYKGTNLQPLLENNLVKLPFHFPTCMMTREFFEYMGGYERYRYSSDSIFSIKIGLFNDLIGNDPIEVIDDILFVWNRHATSITMYGGRVGQELDACQQQQRSYIFKLREKLVSRELPTKMTKDQAYTALELKNNLDLEIPVKEIQIEKQ